MCQKILRDARLFPALLKIDEELAAEARFSPPVDDGMVPSSLLDRLGGGGSVDGLIGMLRFISPITTAWRPKDAGSTMGA